MTEKLLINQDKSNNFDVKSNEELFKQALVEGVSRHFDKTIEEAKKNEQIEEMAEILINIQSDFNEYCAKPCRECELGGIVNCENHYKATALYNAGYRKQSEGEWIENEDDFWVMCSECGTEFLDDQIGIVNTYNYCPFCGAKMKGGE